MVNMFKVKTYYYYARLFIGCPCSHNMFLKGIKVVAILLPLVLISAGKVCTIGVKSLE